MKRFPGWYGQRCGVAFDGAYVRPFVGNGVDEELRQTGRGYMTAVNDPAIPVAHSTHDQSEGSLGQFQERLEIRLAGRVGSRYGTAAARLHVTMRQPARPCEEACAGILKT